MQTIWLRRRNSGSCCTGRLNIAHRSGQVRGSAGSETDPLWNAFGVWRQIRNSPKLPPTSLSERRKLSHFYMLADETRLAIYRCQLHRVATEKRNRISMDGCGARDNVLVERVWKSVKYEELRLLYIRRPHSSLDRQTPDHVYFDSQPLVAAA